MLGATRYRAAADLNRQNQLSSEMAKLQQTVSSQKRLTKASDDPTAATRITELRQDQADQLVWSKNVDTGKAISSAADASLGSIGDLLDRAKELVLSGRNDTTSNSDRSIIASSLRELAKDLDNIALTADPSGNPLFPANGAIGIPVSDTLRLPATAGQDDIFGNVTTAGGAKTLQQILNGAADAIVNTDSSARGTAVNASIAEIDAGANHIIQARADQGVRARRFEDAGETLEEDTLRTKETRSQLEDTDLAYALSTYQAKDLSLKAAQQVYAQTMRSSLFDLLG